MRKFYEGVVNQSKIIIIIFVILAILSAVLQNFVAVNYDMNDYLPETAKSTVSIDIMQNEFEGGIPNARVMITNVTIPEALEVKKMIENVAGVTDVMWLDDSIDVTVPLSTYDSDMIETYYKDSAAVFNVTIDEESRISAVDEIKEIIGEEGALTGAAVSTAYATINTVNEIMLVTAFAVAAVLIILLITTTSWMEPLVVLVGLGVAILINNGTNLIFGEISFVTNAAGSILQLAVSLDYSVFLLHRFMECRNENGEVKEAMVEALCKSTSSILSSGATTVIGFLALALMQFKIGPDLGIALAKGVAISLITVFILMPAILLSTYKWLDKTKHRPFIPDLKFFGKLVSKLAFVLVPIFAIVIIPSYLASNSNSFYYGSSEILGEGTEYGDDTKAIEEIFGKKDTYVLMVPKGDSVTETKLSEELHELDKVTDIISFVDLAGSEVPKAYLPENDLKLLESENYSRFVISVDVPSEGEDTFLLVKQIRQLADKYYPKENYLAGEGVSTYDLMDTVTADMAKVNLIAIAAVFIVLLITMKSVSVPIILVLSIETAIWLNLSFPYFSDKYIFYIAYLIISSIQLGATVDYAILMTDRYKENRLEMKKKEAIIQTVADTTVSILTSGSVLTIVGFLLGMFSTNGLLAQLGIFIGRGALLSLAIVLFILPGLLYMCDKVIIKKRNRKDGGLLHE